jgi:hypothetical protein
MIRKIWQAQITKFLAFIALLVLAMLVGPPLVDTLKDLDPGDAATWFQGLAATGVAVVAVKISRDSHLTARSTLALQLREEASNVTWWFEEFDADLRAENFHTNFDVGWFEDEHGSAPWERGFPETDAATGFAIVRVNNDNATIIGEVKLMVDGWNVNPWSAGLKLLGMVRHGSVRNLVVIDSAGGSELSWHHTRLSAQANAWASWLEFTDSNGYRWRRYADGRLEPQDPKLKKLRRPGTP